MCKYLRIRSRKYTKYCYCVLWKKEMNKDWCSCCNEREFKQYSKMKNKSNRLQKLEKNRSSIITEDNNHCYLCHKLTHCDKHEAFFGKNRQQSIKYKLIFYLCPSCHTISNFSVHNNYFTDLKLKQIAQKTFETKYSHEEFMNIFQENYL